MQSDRFSFLSWDLKLLSIVESSKVTFANIRFFPQYHILKLFEVRLHRTDSESFKQGFQIMLKLYTLLISTTIVDSIA